MVSFVFLEVKSWLCFLLDDRGFVLGLVILYPVCGYLPCGDLGVVDIDEFSEISKSLPCSSISFFLPGSG